MVPSPQDACPSGAKWLLLSMLLFSFVPLASNAALAPAFATSGPSPRGAAARGEERRQHKSAAVARRQVHKARFFRRHGPDNALAPLALAQSSELPEDVKEDIRREVQKEVRRQVSKEIEDGAIEEQVEAEIEQEVKQDLVKEGIIEEERMSRIGKQSLEGKWRFFWWAVGFLFLIVVLLFCLINWGPEMRLSHQMSSPSSPAGPVVPLAPTESQRTPTTTMNSPQHTPTPSRELMGITPRDLETSRWVRKIPFGVPSAICASVVMMPVGVAASFFSWPHGAIFWLNLAAIIPESFLIGIATEELALHIGDSAGALLNASFGNASELIFVYLLLKDGLLDACAGSLVGSILSNHLVLLGLSFLVGGVLVEPPYKIRLSREAYFNGSNALNQAQHLLVASFSVTLPAVFASSQHVTPEHVLALSQAFSGFLVLSYIALVFFQLQNPSEPLAGAQLSVTNSLVMLIVSTVLMAISSECMVHSLDDFCREMGLSQTFVGVVLLPIAGDLSHSSAIYLAMKNKMDLAIDISLQSSIQIALLVIPYSVILGLYLGQPMTLGFVPVHSVMLVTSAIITFAVVVDGRSNWLRGYTLLTTFTLVCLVVFFMPDHDLE
jgi:Ca2+:H+ antiporter